MLSKAEWRERWEACESEAAFIAEQKGTDALTFTIDCGDLLLVPVSRQAEKAVWCFADMAEWRQDAKDAYPNDPFVVTYESMGLWAELYYFPEPRLLWLIYPAGDLSGAIGHMGFRLNRETWPVCELDGILRGDQTRGRGLMSSAFGHINDLIQPDTWTVYPRPENEGAKHFYSRLGFVPVVKPGHMYEGVCEAWEWHRCKDTSKQASVAYSACQGPQEANQNI